MMQSLVAGHGGAAGAAIELAIVLALPVIVGVMLLRSRSRGADESEP